MQSWEDGAVDAVVTDPPYLNLKGTYRRDYQGGVGKKVSITQCVGDKWDANLCWVSPVERVATAAVAFCSFAGVAELRGAFVRLKPIGLVTWYKRNSAPTGKNVPYYSTEFAWAMRSEASKVRWDRLPILIDEPNINAGCMATERLVDEELKALHPTQKPLAVMQPLILNGAATIADPFMGSGTTGVAAVRLGRSFYGVEIDPGYFEIAKQRIIDELNRLPLFEPPPPTQRHLALERDVHRRHHSSP
jgi:DNA modification methylase